MKQVVITELCFHFYEPAYVMHNLKKSIMQICNGIKKKNTSKYRTKVYTLARGGFSDDFTKQYLAKLKRKHNFHI